MRVAAVAAGLIGAFMVSAAVGGIIARQMRGTVSIVAVASPTPAITLSATLVAASATASASATSPTSASPSAIATATGTPQPSPSVTPSPLDPPTVEQFTQDLAAAIAGGDEDYLNSRLHPAVTDRFGTDECRRHIRRDVASGPVQWEVLAVSGPSEYVYASDALETVIPDAWTVTVREPGANPEQRDLHFAPANGTWRWFTDCGDPR